MSEYLRDLEARLRDYPKESLMAEAADAIANIAEDREAYVRLADAALEDRTVLRDRYEELEQAAQGVLDLIGRMGREHLYNTDEAERLREVLAERTEPQGEKPLKDYRADCPICGGDHYSDEHDEAVRLAVPQGEKR